jgi:hypothetical protein
LKTDTKASFPLQRVKDGQYVSSENEPGSFTRKLYQEALLGRFTNKLYQEALLGSFTRKL